MKASIISYMQSFSIEDHVFNDLLQGLQRDQSTDDLEEHSRCLTFRVHIQSKLQFQNASQLTAYYRWMSNMLNEAYYALEKEYMTPDQGFKMPDTPNATCSYCKTSD